MKRDITEIARLEIWREFANHFKNHETSLAYLAEISEFEHKCQKTFLEAGDKEVEYYYEWLQKRNSQGEISSSTFGKKFWELHSFAAFAEKRRGEYEVPSNFKDFFYPWIKAVGRQEKFVQSIPIEHMDALYLAAEEDLMAYAVISLIHRVGLSSKEIGDVKPKDIAEYENGVFVYVANREENCFIPPDAVQILERYLSEREDRPFLFYNRKGAALNKMYISRLLKKYTQKAEIPSYSAEKIRTTCGMTMFAYGANSRQVAKQMGITGTQIQKYQNRQYRDNLVLKANELVKIKVEPPA